MASTTTDKGEVARFRIKSNYGPYGDGPKKSIEIIVYDKAKNLRAAAWTYSGEPCGKAVGICHPYTRIKVRKGKPDKVHHDSGIVRLCLKHCGIGVLTHEIAHAVVGIYDYEHVTRLEPGEDEAFAWIMGDFVRLAVAQMYEHGVWE